MADTNPSYVKIGNNLYIQVKLHHDESKKLILCSDDWGKYCAGQLQDIEMEDFATKHGYQTCKHVHVAKYSCRDFVAFKKDWGPRCPARNRPDGGRAQSRPLRTATNFDEFKKYYAKSSELTVTNQTRYDKTIDLILDPICLRKFNSGRFSEINLHKELEYHCCEHVFHTKFTCNHKIFFKRAPPGQGRSVYSFPCPFHDAGRACSD